MIFNFVKERIQDADTLQGHGAEYFAPLEELEKRSKNNYSKNIFDSSILRQGDYDGTNPTIRVSQNVEDRPYVEVGETYTISSRNSELLMSIGVTDENNSIIQSGGGVATGTRTVTISKSGYLFTVFGFAGSDGIDWNNITVTDVVNAKVQIERGTVATEYEEFFKNNKELTEDCAKKKDLANYFPKSGGEVNGNVEVKSTTNEVRKVAVENFLRRVTLEVGTDGTVYLWDATNNKPLASFTLDGSNTINGTASGNLPLDGGGTVKAPISCPMGIQNTASLISMLEFLGKDGRLGLLGFDGADNPIFYDTSHRRHSLLHDGNSAKVVISDTAPSDTSALWVY